MSTAIKRAAQAASKKVQEGCHCCNGSFIAPPTVELLGHQCRSTCLTARLSRQAKVRIDMYPAECMHKMQIGVAAATCSLACNVHRMAELQPACKAMRMCGA